LVVYYERLRRDATQTLGNNEGLGLALFLRRGMAAWIEAWSQCAGAIEKDARPQAAPDETLPRDVRSQIATLLADMILNLQPEATL